MTPDAVKGAMKEGQLEVNRGTRRISVRQLGRVAGHGLVGGLKGARDSSTAGLVGWPRVIWVIGSLSYVAVQDNLNELGHEVNRRYQEGRLNAKQYRECFGQEVPLPERVR